MARTPGPLLALALLLLGFPAPALEEGPVEVPLGEVTGRVLDDTTETPVAGAAVSLLDRIAVTDGQGVFRFSDVPSERQASLNLRILNGVGEPIGCTTLEVPVRFYPVAAVEGERVAVAIADPAVPTAVELRLTSVPLDEIDKFCAGCHRPNPCVRETETEGDWKGLAGIAVREDEVEELKERLRESGLQREAFSGLRYQDAHPQGVDLSALVGEDEDSGGRLQRPPGLTLAAGGRLACDTCHTRHLPTADPTYLHMEFATQSTLCYQCHL